LDGSMFPFPAVLHMDVAQQGHFNARVEERAKSGSDIKAVESEIAPLLRYDTIWQTGKSHFVAIYNPRFIHTHSWNRRTPDPNLINPATLNLTDPNDTPFSALHNGGIAFEHLRNRLALKIYQFVAYGPITTTALLVNKPWEGDGPPPDPNPILPATIASRFTLLFLQTQVTMPYRLTKRSAIIPEVAYNAFGGADQKSRGVIALTQGPGAGVSFDYAATREDRFISHVGGGRISTTFQDERDGAIIYRAEATQAWRHYWSNGFSTEFLGGGTIGGDNINGFSIYSLGSATLLYDTYPLARVDPGAQLLGGPGGHGARVQIGLIAKVAPWIDLFSGDLEQRAVGAVAANYIVDRVTLRGQLGTARVFNTPRSVAQYQVVFSDLGVRFQLTTLFAADTGVRLGYQKFNNAVRFNELTQVTGYIGLSFTPPYARF
jgi:hypothetical protein